MYDLLTHIRHQFCIFSAVADPFKLITSPPSETCTLVSSMSYSNIISKIVVLSFTGAVAQQPWFFIFQILSIIAVFCIFTIRQILILKLICNKDSLECTLGLWHYYIVPDTHLSQGLLLSTHPVPCLFSN